MKFIKSFALIALTLPLVLSGCGGDSSSSNQSDEKTPTENTTAMGRFVEKDFEIPEIAKSAHIISLFKDSENSLLLYTQGDGGIKSYSYSENNWTEKDSPWLKQLQDTYPECILRGMTLSNGHTYAIVNEIIGSGDDALYKPHVVKTSDGLSFEEVLIEDLDKLQEHGDMKYYTTPYNIAVSQSGNIALSFMDVIITYDSNGNILQETIPAGSQGYTLAVSGENVITCNYENTSIVIYDFTTGNLVKELPYGSSNEYPYLFVDDSDGTIYLGNTNGIQRVAENGTTWEVLVEGYLTSLSLPSLYSGKLVKLGERFYTVFSNQNENRSFYYEYDSSMPSVPSLELTVYSFEENSTVRQAIGEYQKVNPDVGVKFRVAEIGDSGETKNDVIRSLNNEILNGSGPDIIILDGMPIDSYVEKGVLADISDIVKPVSKGGTVLDGVYSEYEKDGKVYAIPSSINIATYMGKPEVVENAKSLKDVAELSQALEKDIFGNVRTNPFLRQMMRFYPELIYDENNGLNEKGIAEFLEYVKTIIENSSQDENFNIYIASEMSINDYSYLRGSNEYDLARGDCEMSYNEMNGFYDSMMTFSLKDSYGFEVVPLNNMFAPVSVVGINAAGDVEHSKELLSCILSDSVQTENIYYGFPVTETALDIYIEREDENKTSSLAVTTGDGSEMFTAEWPSKENRIIIKELCQSANKAAKDDYGLLEIIINESQPFFEGSQSAEDTAKRIVERSIAYINE